MKRILLVLTAFLFSVPLAGEGLLFRAPKIRFTRDAAPTYYFGPGVKRLAVTQWDGTECVFALLHLVEPVKATGVAFDDLRSKASLSAEELRTKFPADLYLATESCACRAQQRTPSNSDDPSLPASWYAATCEARIRVMDGRDGRELATVAVSGMTTEDEREEFDNLAYMTAGKDLSRNLVRMILPHQREITLELDKKTPGEKEAFKAVKAKDYAAARAVWEKSLATSAPSASLNFNLAAVSDAIGDNESARKYYEEAARLDPKKYKYQSAKKYFEERQTWPETLKAGVPRFPAK